MEYSFSDRIASLKPSAIREILKATSQPGMIPLAAGNPAPEAFPVKEAEKIAQDIFANHPVEALQYGVTEGYAPLLECLQPFVKSRYGVGQETDGMMITSGAQQVMDLSAKVLCNEGDIVVAETPSFIGSLNTFRSYNISLRGVPVEADGMDLNRLEEILKSENKVKFIYTIPNFQNPTGVTMSLTKRHALLKLAQQYDVLILEDDPYGELRVSGEALPTIKSMDTEGRVIYSGSFSKIFAPGIRVGYVVANKNLLAKMVVGKQASDVHTSVFSQMLVNAWLRTCDMDAHIEKIRSVYRRKLEIMDSGLQTHLKDLITYNKPRGGLFLWCDLPEDLDMLALTQRAVEYKVAVVPGSAFMVEATDKCNAIRLNFSTPTDEQLETGVRLLGEAARSLR